ncbi:Conjugal transfer protein TrbJ (plasmid) [Cupriavidus necator H16]|uniref:Conjugal transfer protein TrbJ n=1 Tax=Cupriavidus necator (strain ATCC 17699 / DSM 428 / KCTC 22496 / NCIMB 10442 / H16 / Stanier 337) TaxID=381666 RepID=Q7WWX9_CUPNH|nr:conjugal transfer protein TrbJ [Cupriavidus necator]AAP86112.1 putative TrbJ-like protein [Cupriavidus necator H16]QCC05581.1 conjugal transfer protein TrbJ [Cupriavidus necator H16]QQB81401.1 conjugal transfer protein TrbJ [Cupriavidus necator]
MKKWIANIAIATSVFGASSAHAALPVTDWVGLIQTTMTAMQSLKTEVYENTNIAYQYKMMANQLLQSTGLDAASLTEQLDAIKDDIGKYEVYGTTLKDLYGTVSDNADYLKKIQSMVVASGKTKEQWFQDQRQLLSNGDKTAKNLFSLGEQIFKNTQSVAQRRQKIQAQVKLSPTAQAAAQSTNQMLDVLASQNSDLLQLMSVRAQADADKDQQSVARETQSAEAMRAITTAQDEELRQLRARVFSRKLQAD